MLNQKKFDTLVGAQLGLRPNSVRNYLHHRKFKPAERRPEGMFVRPYYNESQIAEAVALLKRRTL